MNAIVTVWKKHDHTHFRVYAELEWDVVEYIGEKFSPKIELNRIILNEIVQTTIDVTAWGLENVP